MTDYYIATTSGSDILGDGSQANPWQTIDHAIDNSVSGDRIFFDEAGSYPATDNKDWSGRSYIASPSTYQTSDGVVFYKTLPVVVDLSGMTTDVNEGIIISTDLVNPTFMQMLHFKNHPDNSLLGAGNFAGRRAVFYKDGAGTTIFNACKFTDNFITQEFQIGGLVGGDSTNKTYFYGCEFRDNKAYSSVVTGLTLFGRTSSSAAGHEEKIENCTFILNEPNNILIQILDYSGDTSNNVLYLKNNIFVHDQTNTIEILDGGGSARIASNNLYWEKNTGSFDKASVASSDDLEENPYFYDYDNKDYRLYPGSPGVNSRTKLETE